jgi:hypothetical protein
MSFIISLFIFGFIASINFFFLVHIQSNPIRAPQTLSTTTGIKAELAINWIFFCVGTFLIILLK